MLDLLREDYHAGGRQSWREPVEVESTNDPGDRSAVLKTEPTTGQDWLPGQFTIANHHSRQKMTDENKSAGKPKVGRYVSIWNGKEDAIPIARTVEGQSEFRPRSSRALRPGRTLDIPVVPA